MLGVVRGSTRVAFGGEAGTTIEIEAGDAVVIPAGAGHCYRGSSSDFVMVDAYLRGQSWNLRMGSPANAPDPREHPQCVFARSGPRLRGQRTAARTLAEITSSLGHEQHAAAHVSQAVATTPSRVYRDDDHEQADRWTWLVLAAYAQPQLALLRRYGVELASDEIRSERCYRIIQLYRRMIQ